MTAIQDMDRPLQGRGIFVTGIDTGVGKTIASAVLASSLGADYWKPVQCGDLENSDTNRVKELLGPKHPGCFHPEAWALKAPQSPHIAAAREGKSIAVADLRLPSTPRPLVVEGAGGCLCPLSSSETMLDIAKTFELVVLVVIRSYLGAFNHSLLTLEVLQRRELPVAGLIMSGSDPLEMIPYLEKRSKLPFLLHIPELSHITAKSIAAIGGTEAFASIDLLGQEIV